MAFRDQYRQQVALLVRAIPFVAAEDVFALKGGTAINLFVRDMPRLSVDIDLTYLPIDDRATSLASIDAAMKRIAARIEKGIPGAQATTNLLHRDNIVSRIIVRADGMQIKIEVTPVLRGCVYEPVMGNVTASVEAEFGFAEIRIVSFADLYAGKIVAALDRQHPRDLFDVRALLANEGISDELRRAFVVYLVSHDRTMAEILSPTRKPLHAEFLRGFEGMTREPVQLDELLAAREALIDIMAVQMPDRHRKFLLSFKQGRPDWSLLGISQAKDLPAIKWKQHNLDKLSPDRRAELVSALETILPIRGNRED